MYLIILSTQNRGWDEQIFSSINQILNLINQSIFCIIYKIFLALDVRFYLNCFSCQINENKNLAECSF